MPSCTARRRRAAAAFGGSSCASSRRAFARTRASQRSHWLHSRSRSSRPSRSVFCSPRSRRPRCRQRPAWPPSGPPPPAPFALVFSPPGRGAPARREDPRQHLAERRLWTDIPEGYRPLMGPLIIVNNVQIAIAAFAGGLTAGALTLYLLVANGAFLGTELAHGQGYGLSGGLPTSIAAHGTIVISWIGLSGRGVLRLPGALLR